MKKQKIKTKLKKTKKISTALKKVAAKTVLPGQCVSCEEEIPQERLRLVKTNRCAPCMELLERKGKGTVRHKMAFEIEAKGEELESINQVIVRN